MGEFKSYREISKGNWGTRFEDPSLDQIKLGAILRIADATELMIANYQSLIAERDRLVALRREGEIVRTRLWRSNTQLRAIIKKLKKKYEQ